MKIIKWIIGLSNTVKAISAIVGFVILISTGLTWYKHRILSNNAEELLAQSKDNEFVELKESFEVFKISFEVFNRSVMDSLATLSSDVRTINKRSRTSEEILNNIRADRMSKALTKDEILEVWRIWSTEEEKKKPGNGSSGTLPGPLILPIQ